MNAKCIPCIFNAELLPSPDDRYTGGYKDGYLDYAPAVPICGMVNVLDRFNSIQGLIGDKRDIRVDHQSSVEDAYRKWPVRRI